MSSLGLFNPASLALSNKFLPVHCVVARDECPQRVLQDGFVIVPAQTKFYDIVSVVLRTMEADVGKIEQDERADGQILIKNWNPLPIPTVTENPTVTVQDILGDLMNVAVLKIRIFKCSNLLDDKRSFRLLKQLMPLVSDERDKHELVNKLSQVMHDDIDDDNDDDDVDDDDDVQHPSLLTKSTTSPNGYSLASSNSNTNDGDNTPLNLSTKPYSSPTTTIPINPMKSYLNYPFSSLLSLAQQQHHQQYESPPIHSSSSSSAIIKDYAYNRRQRERTTFDPHEETPRLVQIFTDTKHPTRYQIASICESLNALPCRKGKKALEPYNIQYWFKNARAALKRKKRRFNQQEPDNDYNTLSLLNEKNNSNEQNNHSSIKCELDSSDELEDDDNNNNTNNTNNDNNNTDHDDKQIQQQQQNYYFNYLKAFDISLTDQQRQKFDHNHQSEDSNDDDNISSISEQQTPPTQILNKISNPTTTTTTGTTFDYNRSRRNRIFIDPASEVPKLEQWFAIETHPDHILIERICSELNEGEYRTKFPKLESKHIRLWFKNHRAKVKRICRIQTPNTTIDTTENKMHNVQ